MLRRLRMQVGAYAQGKKWYWYLPLWLFGVYTFIAILDFHPNEQSAFIVAVAYSFNFMLHEMAHILTAFLPEFLTAAAGSFSELLLGSLLVYGAFKTRAYFASLFCFLWLMLALRSAGIYMADARAQEMGLVSLGGQIAGSDEAIHDWYFIFGKLNLLSLDTFIGGSVQLIGALAGIVGLGFTAWVMYKMAGEAKAKELTRQEAELLHKAAIESGLNAAPVKHFESLKNGSIYPTPYKGSLAERPAPKQPPKQSK